MPAILLIDQTGTIRFAEIIPECLARSEPETILAAAQPLMTVKVRAA